MQEHSLPATRTARYFTLGAQPSPRDVWFVCHGYGQLAARFLERFHAIESDDRCLVAPEALSRFYLSDSPSERRVGASWMTREDRLHEIEDYVRYLDAVYTAIAPPSPRERARTTVLGFSQGAATACRWTASGSSRIDRLIVWGGEIPPDLDFTDERVAGRLRTAHVTLVYGSADELFTPKIVAATEERLRRHGILYECVPFDGGHEIHEPTLRKLATTSAR